MTGYEVQVGTYAPATGGYARTPTDSKPSGVAMSSTLLGNIASLSKVLTTIAVLQSLNRNNISLDAVITPYLWPNWGAPATSLSKLTFRQLLQHKSGFRNAANDGCANNTNCNTHYVNCWGDATAYSQIQQIMASGVDANNVGTADYDNCNFAIFRELLPFMEGQKYSGPADDTDRAQWSASFYVNYMNQHVFAPVGIGTRGCSPTDATDFLAYSNPAGTNPGTDWDGWSALSCGGGGWYLSGADLMAVLTDIATGSKLLSPAEKQLMNGVNGGSDNFSTNDNTLGWDNTVRNDCPAPNLCKNGGLGGPGSGDPYNREVSTYLGIVGCNTPVVAIVNSPLPASGSSDIIDVVGKALAASSAPGTPVCCDGSTPCNGECCGAGQVCSSAGVCAAPTTPPSCTVTDKCPPSYGAQLMTVSCTSAVNFFKYDSYDGNLSAEAGSPTTSFSTATETYPDDYLVACPVGINLSWWSQQCSKFSTYEPKTSWCGPVSGGGGGTKCPTGTHYCGPDEGCQRLCT